MFIILLLSLAMPPTRGTPLHLNHPDNLAILSDNLNIGSACGVYSFYFLSCLHCLAGLRRRFSFLSLPFNLLLMIRSALLTLRIWYFPLALLDLLPSSSPAQVVQVSLRGSPGAAFARIVKKLFCILLGPVSCSNPSTSRCTRE